mgnify:CR=1 FL=1
MTGIDANVYNNIFGCSDFAALDRTYVDADKNKEAQRKTSAWNNLFFNNLEADLTMPSGGGKFARIFAKQFEDVDQLVKYEGNREMTESEVKTISRAIDAPYDGHLLDGTQPQFVRKRIPPGNGNEYAWHVQLLGKHVRQQLPVRQSI